MADQSTYFDQLMAKLKNNKRVAVVFLCFSAFLAVGAFSDAFQKIRGGVSTFSSPDAVFATARVYRTRPTKSLSEELVGAETVWIAWHTGSTQLASEQLLSTKRNLRVVLIDPDSVTLDSHAKLGKMPKSLMADGIRQMTKNVVKYGGEVRWLDGPVQNSITIVDPDLDRGWIRIELLLPFQEAVFRPSLLVTKKDDPELFLRLRKTFMDIWDRSSAVRQS